MQFTRRAALLCLCAGLIGARTGAAANADALDTAELDSVVEEWLADTHAPSASIAIVRQGRLAYAQGYGAARLGPKMPATPATRYAIDSVSKEFTAAALLKLAERGDLSLDDPLRNWFPALGAASAVTLRQLLTHTSGIRDYWPQDFITPEMAAPTTRAALIEEWAQRPLDFEPGTDWQYSNTGYVLAGAVIEAASGEGLFDFLDSNVFKPLHMTGAVPYPPRGEPALASPGPNAVGYTRYGLGPVAAAPREGSGWLFGAAGLAMRASDLALWDVSLIDRSLLEPASYQAELQPVVLKDGRVQSYALGLYVELIRGRLRIGHTGAGSGFLADNRIWPSERTAIVVLTNNDWAGPGELTDRLAFAVLPPTPEEARAQRMFKAMQDGTVDRASFTATGNFYLTAAVLADLHSSLSKLGPARLIELEGETHRGGMTTRRWRILCRAARLEATERSHADGKFDEFMIVSRQD